MNTLRSLSTLGVSGIRGLVKLVRFILGLRLVFRRLLFLKLFRNILPMVLDLVRLWLPLRYGLVVVWRQVVLLFLLLVAKKPNRGLPFRV